MRKTAIGLISSAVALCLSACTPASAADVGQDVQSAQTHMVLNGQDWSNPAHLVRGETTNSEPTSWLPIWYLFGVLSKLNIQSTWDGRHWNLQLPSGMHADLTQLPVGSSRANEVSIQIGGTTVEYMPRFVHRDLGGNIMTSYIPIWYLMQALHRVGIASTWDGTTWSMTTSESSPLVTKMTVVKDFMDALHIEPDASGSNPFDDVGASDWPYVNAVLQKGYFTSDSTSHFGSIDSVDVETADHAYQLFAGIPDSDLSWNAGGNTVTWANAIELNQGVAAGALTATSEVQLMSNLAALYQGFSKNANGTYRLWFQPYDAKTAFAHDSYVTASMAERGQEIAIPLIDAVQLKTLSDKNLQFTLPGVSDTDLREISCGSLFNLSGNKTMFSLDGGTTWAVATGFDGYDSRDPDNGGLSSVPRQIMVKTAGHVEIVVSYIYPKDDVTFAAASVTPASSGNPPTFRYVSGEATWSI